MKIFENERLGRERSMKIDPYFSYDILAENQ